MTDKRSTDSCRAVLILYNAPDMEGGAGLVESRAGVLAEVRAVSAVLAGRGIIHRAIPVRTLAGVRQVFKNSGEPLVFNLVEELEGRADDYSLVPAVCRAFNKACTGSDAACLLLTQDKWRTKAVLRACGIPVPDGALISPGADLTGALPGGRVIIKPAYADASEGITEARIVDSSDPQVKIIVEQLHKEFRQPVLVEQFVGIREFNVSIIERKSGKVEVLPVAEIDFTAFPPEKARIVDYKVKWMEESFEYNNTPRVVPAQIDAEKAGELQALALRSWHAAGCSGYVRVDMRMDKDGRIHVLEINANPDISPDAGFAAALAAAGIAYEDFVEETLLVAERKGSGASGPAAGVSCVEHKHFGIRRVSATDRNRILEFAGATGFFRPVEMEIAREVLDEAIDAGPDVHYQCHVSVSEGAPVGWLCFGPTPCTESTFDIYWVVVDNAHQRKGIGKALMLYAEKEIAGRGGRMCIIETSGRQAYKATQGFYKDLGYAETARVPGFYAPGDDKVIYAKAISGAQDSFLSSTLPKKRVDNPCKH